MALVLAAPAGLSGTVENVFTATEAVFDLGSSHQQWLPYKVVPPQL